MKCIRLDIQKVKRLDNNATPGFCFDDCVATYSNNKKLQYPLMYVDVLKNSFNDRRDANLSIGDRIVFSTNILENFRNYVGVEEVICTDEIRHAAESMKQHIKKGTPVLVRVNGYNCPWDWRYQVRNDGEHTLFLVGWDDLSQSFICLDPYYDRNGDYYPLSELNSAYRNYSTFKTRSTNPFDAIEIICNKLEELQTGLYIESMKQLPGFMREGFDFDLEITNYNQNKHYYDEFQDDVKINVALKEIVHNRVRYSNLLNYIVEKYDYFQMKNVCNGFLAIAEKWNVIRLSILKYITLKKEESLKTIVPTKIERVLEEEEKLISLTLDKFRCIKEGTINSIELLDDQAVTKMEFVDISSHKNNKGLGNGDDGNADFNGEKECFLAEKFNKCDYISCEHMKFQFNNDDSRYDNIICDGQTIHINNKICKKIFFLCCSDFGNITETIRIEYEDGSSADKVLKVKDWVPNYNDELCGNIAIEAQKTVVARNGKIVDIENAFIYAEEIDADCKNVRDIILPVCSNFHVFAISLLSIQRNQ